MTSRLAAFIYIDECITSLDCIKHSDQITFLINLGSAEKASINQLVDIV